MLRAYESIGRGLCPPDMHHIIGDPDMTQQHQLTATTHTLVAESLPESGEIGNFIEEVVDLARQINSEVDSEDVQELLNSCNQELTFDELMEMHE
ncbi:hypothetical protein TNCV_4521321 [Trichonephila clavipes]|nr:hypothetical protein TNCV_4521321 [Trichonephila clavipes]